MHEITTVSAKHIVQESKIKRLLNNPDIKRWHDDVARASPSSARTQLYNLDAFCKEHQIRPMQLAELAMKDLKTVSDLLQDHITLMEQRTNSPNYIHIRIEAVKSWLANFDVKITRKLRIANVGSTPTLQNEKVPEASELSEMFNRADLRVAAIESLITKAGLRPKVLGNHNGTDGLMMKDLPDIAIIQGIATCLRSPPRIIVRKSLSKAKHQYFAFLTSQGTKKLLAYLNDRLAKGEALTAESPVIAIDTDHKYGRRKDNKFLLTGSIWRLIKQSFRPRFNWRPYVLRAYFDTQLLFAESRGKLARDFRVFWMGHKGSIEAKYTTNKAVLPETLIDEMRESFKRCEEFLDLELKEEDPLLKQKEELKVVIDKATPEQMQKMFQLLNICNT